MQVCQSFEVEVVGSFHPGTLGCIEEAFSWDSKAQLLRSSSSKNSNVYSDSIEHSLFIQTYNHEFGNYLDFEHVVTQVDYNYSHYLLPMASVTFLSDNSHINLFYCY